MDRLKAVDEEAHSWLAEHGGNPKRWSKAFFRLTVKSDMLSSILKARDKPIITMLETIRRLVMCRIRDRKIAMERKPGLVCPRIKKILDDRYELSSKMQGRWNGGDEWEVEAFGHSFTVNVRNKECTCRIWQLTGIPCAHSIPCITERGLNPVDVVDDQYSRIKFIQNYENVLHPTTSAEFWETTPGVPLLGPPQCVRMAGRPKKSRRRGADEVATRPGKYCSSRKGKQRCSVCGQAGHNKQSCPKKPKSSSQVDGQVGSAPSRKRTRKSNSQTTTQVDEGAGPSTSKRRKTQTKKMKEKNLETLKELMGNMDLAGKHASSEDGAV